MLLRCIKERIVSNKHDLVQEAVQIATRGAPPISVVGLTFMGFELEDFVLILTIVWLVVQITIAIYNFVGQFFKKRKDDEKDGKNEQDT